MWLMCESISITIIINININMVERTLIDVSRSSWLMWESIFLKIFNWCLKLSSSYNIVFFSFSTHAHNQSTDIRPISLDISKIFKLLRSKHRCGQLKNNQGVISASETQIQQSFEEISIIIISRRYTWVEKCRQPLRAKQEPRRGAFLK